MNLKEAAQELDTYINRYSHNAMIGINPLLGIVVMFYEKAPTNCKRLLKYRGYKVTISDNHGRPVAY